MSGELLQYPNIASQPELVATLNRPECTDLVLRQTPPRTPTILQIVDELGRVLPVFDKRVQKTADMTALACDNVSVLLESDFPISRRSLLFGALALAGAATFGPQVVRAEAIKEGTVLAKWLPAPESNWGPDSQYWTNEAIGIRPFFHANSGVIKWDMKSPFLVGRQTAGAQWEFDKSNGRLMSLPESQRATSVSGNCQGTIHLVMLWPQIKDSLVVDGETFSRQNIADIVLTYIKSAWPFNYGSREIGSNINDMLGYIQSERNLVAGYFSDFWNRLIGGFNIGTNEVYAYDALARQWKYFPIDLLSEWYSPYDAQEVFGQPQSPLPPHSIIPDKILAERANADNPYMHGPVIKAMAQGQLLRAA